MEIEALRPRHRFTVKQYYEMGALGFLEQDARFELIDGDIIEMPPAGPAHANIVNRLAAILVRAVEDRVGVTIQTPVLLGESNQPEPDVCLVKPREVYYHRHPEAEDVLLVIEVGESSVAYDRIKKGRLYSRSWIPEYWLIDIPGQRVEVYLSPGPDGYTEKLVNGREDRISPAALPDIEIDINDILGPS